MITTAIVAWCTLMALAPPRRPLAVGAMSFLFGFVLNELPFVALAYLAVSTWLGFTQGGNHPSGFWAMVGLAAVTAAGLAVVAWRGLRTGAAVSHALAEGLGGDWPSTLDAGLAPRLHRRLPLARILFAPVIFRRHDVQRLPNIRYGDAGRKNLLDVYRHRAHPSGGPLLIHLHGGFLVTGKKNREALPLLYRLASQGWVCISANYRLRPRAQFPDYLVDAKKVIAWAREHADEYGADPSMVFIAGSSSGGQLAALAALTQGDPVYQPGFEQADTSVAAAICLHGYYGDAGDQNPASPLADDAASALPFFLAHGDQDSLVPVEAARLFAAKLRAASRGPVVYAELPGAQHGFDRFHSLRFEQVVDGIEAFTAWIRSREHARTASRG